MYQNKISGSIVIVDGSNVAMYGMSKSGKKKAVLENILSVINKLKEYKASEIITICDANIRYIISLGLFNLKLSITTLIIEHYCLHFLY